MFGQVRVRAPGPGCARPWRRAPSSRPAGWKGAFPSFPVRLRLRTSSPLALGRGWARGSRSPAPARRPAFTSCEVDFDPTFLSALGRPSHQVTAVPTSPLTDLLTQWFIDTHMDSRIFIFPVVLILYHHYCSALFLFTE